MLPIVVLSLLAGALAFASTFSVIYTAVVTLVMGALFYLGAPTFAFDNPALWLTFSLLAVLHAILAGLMDRARPILVATVGIPLLGLIIGGVSSMGLFRAKDYQAMLGEPEIRTLAADLPILDQSQVRIVDNTLALRRAEELLGTVSSLGSRAKLGKPAIQAINGKLEWIVPIEHSGFFQWNRNPTIPGYIRVSASNLLDASFVQTLGGNTLELAYMPSAYFGNDIERHLYLNGYNTAFMEEPLFNIDDEGKPYWVVSLTEKTIGFSGEVVTKLITVDAVTGAIVAYDVKDVPQWVERVYPEKMVEEQIDHWGEYIHGAMNWAREDTLTSTPGISLVYTADGQPMWYTGVQSEGRDNGTVGFMLVNSRTKKANYYRVVGATENGAKDAIEGLFSAERWTATHPILYNVDGVPTYISSLKDANGNFKAIGMISVENRLTVAAGPDALTALKAYRAKIRSTKVSTALETGTNFVRYQGAITRLGSETLNGQVILTVMLDSNKDVAFTIASQLSPEVVLTHIGDKIAVEVQDTEGGILSVIRFDNLDITLRRGQNEKQAESDTEQRLNTEQTQQKVRAETKDKVPAR